MPTHLRLLPDGGRLHPARDHGVPRTFLAVGHRALREAAPPAGGGQPGRAPECLRGTRRRAPRLVSPLARARSLSMPAPLTTILTTFVSSQRFMAVRGGRTAAPSTGRHLALGPLM